MREGIDPKVTIDEGSLALIGSQDVRELVQVLSTPSCIGDLGGLANFVAQDDIEVKVVSFPNPIADLPGIVFRILAPKEQHVAVGIVGTVTLVMVTFSSRVRGSIAVQHSIQGVSTMVSISVFTVRGLEPLDYCLVIEILTVLKVTVSSAIVSVVIVMGASTKALGSVTNVVLVMLVLPTIFNTVKVDLPVIGV